jgi:hypothetical protein
MNIASVPVPVEIGHVLGAHAACSVIVRDIAPSTGTCGISDGLLTLSAESVTLAGESVTLASLALPAECVTLAGVATLASSGIPLGFFEVDLLLLSLILDLHDCGTSSSLTISFDICSKCYLNIVSTDRMFQ